MHEYVAQAVILDTEPFRDYDTRVTFFTERFGKLTGKATSTRKTTSKLAAHLEPGSFVNLRFVENKNLQIVDGLRSGKVRASQPDLYRLHQILPEGEPEAELWQLFRENKFEWKTALKILGWDPNESTCVRCANSSQTFHIARQEMYCRPCAVALPNFELLTF